MAMAPLSQTIATEADAVAAYNQLISEGYSDAAIRAAADQIYGTQSDADWAYLQSLSAPSFTSIADMNQQQVENYLSTLADTQTLEWTPGTGYSDNTDIAVSGPAGYATTGYGVTPEYTTVWQGEGDNYGPVQVPTGNYISQLTPAFDPSTGGTYGFYNGVYDSAGNLIDVQFEKGEKNKGWFGENLDWLGPLLVLGPAAVSAGLFGGASAGAGTLGAEAAIDFGALTGANASTIAGINATGFGASELAATAYSNAIANGASQEVANMAADVAAALEGSGMSAADILSTANTVASDTMSLGAVDAAGNVIGGGGSLTIDAGAGLGGAVAGMDQAGLNSLITSLTSTNPLNTPYVDLADTLGTGITETTGAGTVGGGVGGTGMTLTELSKATGLSETVLSKAASAGSSVLQSVIKSVAPSLSNIIGGGINLAAANALFNKVSALGPQIRDAYTALGTDVLGKYGDVSGQIKGNLGGLFDASKAASLGAYGAAGDIDLANLRQQEFDIMQAMMADPRAAQAAQVEDRRRAQGLGGLQSFNQAYSAQFTDPTTGQSYTVGADPAQVAMYKAWANQDLANYLQADKNALARYTGLLGAGSQQATQAQNLQSQWMTPLTTGVGTYANLGSTGLQAWGTAEKAAADAYAKMVQGLAGGASQGLTGTNLNNTLSGLWDYFTNSNRPA